MRKVLLGVFLLATFTMTNAFGAAATTAAADTAGGELLFGSPNTNGVLTLSGSPVTVTWAMSAGYQRTIMPALQVGIRGNFGIQSTPQAWKALVWGVWNFDEKLADAIFLGVGAGLSGGTIAFDLGAEIGKRFELMPNLTWRPTVELQHTFTTGAPWTFTVNLINFSYIW